MPSEEPVGSAVMTSEQDILICWRKLGQMANGIIPTTIRGEPNRDDAVALISDLRVLVRDVDALIEAYGRYAKSTLGINQIDVVECFTDQLSNALENAFHVIEKAIDDREQFAADTEAEMRRDFWTAAE